MVSSIQHFKAKAFDIAMRTLRQIADTPRNAGARRNARATVAFIETQQESLGRSKKGSSNA